MDAFSASVVEQLMTAIWSAAIWLLRSAFGLMDGTGAFGQGMLLVDDAGRPAATGPLRALWPGLVWVGGAVAVGLFLWQLTLTMLRGGVGFWRIATGPVSYGLATAMTLGGVAVLIGAGEGLTAFVLQQGLAAPSFRSVLDHPGLGMADAPALDGSVEPTTRAVLLGMLALFGVLPAAVGFLLQMVFRQVAILVLIATVPITAAGLMAQPTAVWFWRSLRWMLAALLMKPALALVLVIGVHALSLPQVSGGPVAGTGVLLISLFCPLALFRMLAPVERVPQPSARPPIVMAVGAAEGILGRCGVEQANTVRFDAAIARTTVGRSRGGVRPRKPALAGGCTNTDRFGGAAVRRRTGAADGCGGTAVDPVVAAGDAVHRATETTRQPGRTTRAGEGRPDRAAGQHGRAGSSRERRPGRAASGIGGDRGCVHH